MNLKQQIKTFENTHSLAQYFLKVWKEEAQKAINQRHRFTVALSGGNAPLAFYSQLAQIKDFDIWKRTHIFQVDERYVPNDHKESNYRLLKENLFDYINIPPQNVHPIIIEGEKLESAAEHYKQKLLKFFTLDKDGMPNFDLVLLGVGEDGHTASLFKDLPGYDDPKRVVLPVSLNRLKQERISLSLSVINHARKVVFIAGGIKKADILKRIIDDKEDLPCTNVAPVQGELLYLLDGEAAVRLKDKQSYIHLDKALAP